MEPILVMKDVSKKFPGVQALDQVYFDLYKGEVHALIGENGAGKSTLMKILGGVYKPDQGVITLHDKHVVFNEPQDSIRQKIGVVYQEFNLVRTLSIYENLFLGKEIKKNPFNQLDRREMKRQAKETMAKLGLEDMDCSLPVKSLSVAIQQLVEIGKAIFNQIDILVLDEPTAVLTEKESQRLFDVIQGIKANGVAIIYISHRLEEVIELSDRITVLRDGQYVETIANTDSKVNKDDLVKRMVGRDLGDYFPPRDFSPSSQTILEVSHLSSALFDDVSFSVKRGEVLGFSGLIGAGRTEIMKSIFGVLPYHAGEIKLDGSVLTIRSALEAKRAGLAYVPEDRKREGLVLSLSLANNIVMSSLERISKGGHIQKKTKRDLVRKLVNDLQIHPKDPERLALYYSGGNQQKAVIAKWLTTKPRVMILDEPTRGIDIGAKIEIYHLINDLAMNGVAVVVISSELTELIGICDRILVVSNGRMTGEFNRPDFSQDAIMFAATNIKAGAQKRGTAS